MVARKMFRFRRKPRDNPVISSLSLNDSGYHEMPNSDLSFCFKFPHSPCLSLRERYLPKGGGEGCADSAWRDAVSYEESVQRFYE